MNTQYEHLFPISILILIILVLAYLHRHSGIYYEYAGYMCFITWDNKKKMWRMGPEHYKIPPCYTKTKRDAMRKFRLRVEMYEFIYKDN